MATGHELRCQHAWWRTVVPHNSAAPHAHIRCGMRGCILNRRINHQPTWSTLGSHRTAGGRSPLHYAASIGHVDCISVLLGNPTPNPGSPFIRPPNKERTRWVPTARLMRLHAAC